MLNVDAGNRPHRPDNPRELRATWRVTWLAVAGLLLFVLLYVGFRVFSGPVQEANDPQTPPGSFMPAPGEHDPKDPLVDRPPARPVA